MSKDEDSISDASPTDELPVLSERDIVDPDGSSVLVFAGPDHTGAHVQSNMSTGGDAEGAGSLSSTDSFRRQDDLLDVGADTTPQCSADDDPIAARQLRIEALESRLEDRDAEVASLAERLRATREAVLRRDQTERQLREELAEAAARQLALESRVAEAEASAAEYADRLAENTSRLRTLELAIGQRDAAFAELEAELVARESQVVERERALAAPTSDRPAAAQARRAAPLSGTSLSGASLQPSGQPPRASHRSASLPAAEHASAKLRESTVPAPDAELQRSREEAAALATYIECRRAHWLAMETQLAEHRARLQELEGEIAQRAARERLEAERAASEQRRADQLKAELVGVRALLEGRRAAPTPKLLSESAAEPTPAAGQAPGAPPAPDGSPAATVPAAAPAASSEPQAEPEAALLCLTSNPPREYPLRRQATMIGRSPHCDIRIATHFVSREHARITRERSHLLIEDLGSKNGVFVNAVRVERGRLRHGDLVTIGETQFRFREDGAQ